MTTRTLTQLVLKIWSVMLLVRTVIAVPALVGYLMQTAGPTMDANILYSARLSTFASLAAQLTAALLMFGAAPALARWIAGEGENVSITTDGQTLVAVGLTIVGITVLVDGIVELGSTVYAWQVTPGDASTNPFTVERHWTAVSRGTLELVIGVVLFVGRDAIVGVWRKLRGADA